jgi:hypothetical protein
MKKCNLYLNSLYLIFHLELYFLIITLKSVVEFIKVLFFQQTVYLFYFILLCSQLSYLLFYSDKIERISGHFSNKKIGMSFLLLRFLHSLRKGKSYYTSFYYPMPFPCCINVYCFLTSFLLVLKTHQIYNFPLPILQKKTKSFV